MPQIIQSTSIRVVPPVLPPISFSSLHAHNPFALGGYHNTNSRKPLLRTGLPLVLKEIPSDKSHKKKKSRNLKKGVS